MSRHSLALGWNADGGQEVIFYIKKNHWNTQKKQMRFYRVPNIVVHNGENAGNGL